MHIPPGLAPMPASSASQAKQLRELDRLVHFLIFPKLMSPAAIRRLLAHTTRCSQLASAHLEPKLIWPAVACLPASKALSSAGSPLVPCRSSRLRPTPRPSARLLPLRPLSQRSFAAMAAPLELESVDIDNPKGLNFILGHSHFIKTVEDLYEALVQSGIALKFGIAFCEASGDRKVRSDGNDEELINLAKQNAMKLGAGHSFIIFLDKGFPVSVLNAVKNVPEVCRIHCATANPTAVIVAKLGEDRKGILGVIDGFVPVDYENEADKKQRLEFLRAIGYKRG